MMKYVYLLGLIVMIGMPSCGHKNLTVANQLCDTCHCPHLSQKSSSALFGTAVLNRRALSLKAVTVYVADDSPFFMHLKSVSKSTPNYTFKANDIKCLTPEPILCNPDRRGFYTVDISDYKISTSDNIFVLFSACTTDSDPGIAYFKENPDGWYLAVWDDDMMTYSNVEGMSNRSPFVSIDAE